MNYRENLLETLEQKTLIGIILDLQSQLSDREIEEELYKETIKVLNKENLDLIEKVSHVRLIAKANVTSQNFNN